PPQDGRRIIEGGVVATTIEEAVRAAGVVIATYDLTIVVDAICETAISGRGIVERGPAAAAVKEAVHAAGGVHAAGTLIKPDDLAIVVDAIGVDVIGG